MARPFKQGLEYFPLDVDFFYDQKIQFVSARFGLKGEIIAIRLLCNIYRDGYFIKWNKDISILFAKSIGDGCQHTLVNDVVFELLKRGFLDSDIFESFGILTSKGIQKRYLEASSRRKKVELFQELVLVDLDMYTNVSINHFNVDINSQSKVKETKVKKSKGNSCSNQTILNYGNSVSKTQNLLLANQIFERLWAIYPRKRGKARVSDSKKLNLLKVGEEQFGRCIQRYVDELQKTNKMDYIQNGSTFFCSGYVDFLDSQFTPIKNQLSNSKNLESYGGIVL